jgi:heterodisulfide reductase subunit A
MSTAQAGRGPRIGVFLCRCGSSISDAVDIGALALAARGLDGVATVHDAPFLCADSGQRLIREEILKERLSRVVVAACSPLMHERTFRKTVQAAGLNPFTLQIANIREQVAWVTPERSRATKKGAALVAAAVRRVARQVSLHVGQRPVVPITLVVGAGIAGVEAALRLADAGKKVVLVEQSPSLGGHMAQLARTYPTLDCSECVIMPKVANAAEHPNITVFTHTRVESVGGSVGRFTVRVRTRPRFVDETRCTGCGLCVDRCPCRDVPSAFDEGLGTRPAVHFPTPQAVPRVPVIDRAACAAHGSRTTCRVCQEVCPCGAVDFEQQDRVHDLEVGAVILATGFDLFDPRRAAEYGYGRWSNVVTSLEFERLCDPSGPTGGRIVMKSGRLPESVAIVHCVGSRDRRFNRHCSRVCCTASLKLALLARQQTGARVVNFYIDMRAAGKSGEEFYEQVQRAGVTFIRGKGTEVVCGRGKLLVKAEDTLLGRQVSVPVDMVVLAVGMEPRGDAAQVARLFGITLGEQGFFAERHLKFAPVQTAVEGVFVAGCCQGPKDIPESLAQGAAAAAGALQFIDPGVVDISPTMAEVDPRRCSGCRLCVGDCPFQAIEIVHVEGREVARVNDVLCQSCGSCAATCPSGAISQCGFTSPQIFAEIEGLLAGC